MSLYKVIGDESGISSIQYPEIFPVSNTLKSHAEW